MNKSNAAGNSKWLYTTDVGYIHSALVGVDLPLG